MEKNSVEKFIFRTPLLKLSNLLTTEEELLNAFNQQKVREALYIASRDLYNELILLESTDIKDYPDKRKIVGNLYKYYTRMCTRCTPFGLFAGISVGNISGETDIILDEDIFPKIRLDMDFLCNLYYELNKNKSLLTLLKFYPNNTLFLVGNQWRYVEYQFKDTTRFHNLVAIDNNDVLSKLMQMSVNGESFDRLLKTIIGFDVEESEAESYLFELIENQVLISSLYPSISGQEYQSRLFDIIESTAPTNYQNLNNNLNKILNEEESIIIKSERIETFLKQFNVKPNSNRLTQIDLLKKTVSCKLNENIKKEIEEVTNILRHLQMRSTSNTILEKFKNAFHEKYEDNFMPLNFIMDTDIGLGYKNSISNVEKSSKQSDIEINKKIKELKLNTLVSSVKNNYSTIELNIEDIKLFLNYEVKPIPVSYAFIGNLLLEDGKTVVKYKSSGGASAINMLGRFGHLNTDIEDLCKKIAQIEETYYQDVIIAEIIHLPQGLIGNIVTRPHYRNYEIPYLCFSTLPVEKQITSDDLYVGIINNRVIIFSKKMNCEIIPRLSNAHNYSADGLPLYHFLCDLQTQNINSSIFWNWDDLQTAEHLPRIMYKNIILSCEKWNLKTSKFKKSTLEKDQTTLIKRFEELKIPYTFLIIEGDNELYVDIKTTLGLYVFEKQCAKSEQLSIEEFLFSKTNSIDGYTNEIIIPFFRKTEKLYEGNKGIILDKDVERIYSPLSNWLYVKIYTGSKFAQNLLRNEIPEIIKELKENEIISKWFFIRYGDPKFHLRIRFLVTDMNAKSKLLYILNQKLQTYLSNHQIWNIEIDTYKRELNRYGHDTIDVCETYFCYNSEFVLSLLTHLQKISEEERLLVAIHYANNLLEQCKYSTSEKSEFVKINSNAFSIEFGINTNKMLRLNLDEQFRNLHQKIKVILYNAHSNSDFYNLVNSIYLEHQIKTNSLISDISAKNTENKSKFTGIVGSFIHMFINRFFSINQRYLEMKVYYFLAKYYSSEIGRNKSKEILEV